MAIKIDWASFEASKFACQKWHYSGTLPRGKLVKFGVWEDGKFIGVVLYSRGASPFIARKYGLEPNEFCELVRVSLKEHKAPVSQIVAITIRLLKKQFPMVKLMVSFADMDQGHNGAIYQAGNWIYTGIGVKGMQVFVINGKAMPSRTFGKAIMEKGYKWDIEWIRDNVDPHAKIKIAKGKHRYLFPLDSTIKKSILALAKPYPKHMRGSSSDRITPLPGDDGGLIPTSSLHVNHDKDPRE